MPYSNSLIAEFNRCQLSAFYRYEKHLHRIDEDASAHHLSFGSAGHKALEVLYTGGTMDDAKMAFRKYYPVQLDPNDLAKTADNGCFTIEKYWDHYQSDKGWKILAVEGREFTEDNFGIKPDLIVKDKNDSIYVVDHKFTGAYLNADYFTQYEPNSQITQYIRWVKERYGYCDGFIVNAVALRYRQRAYKGEPAGFWCAFERQVYNRTSSQIERTVTATQDTIADIERAKQRGYWRPNEQSNACKFCSYKVLCGAGWSWEEDESLILSQFRQTCDEAVSSTEEHCTLNLGHEGNHSTAIQVSQPIEFEVTV